MQLYPYYYSEEKGRLNSRYMSLYLGIHDHETALEKGFVPLDLSLPPHDPRRQSIRDQGTIVDTETKTARIDWLVEDLPREVQIKNISEDYLKEIDKYMDRVAQAKGYDNRVTCSLRAGYSGPYQSEGAAFASWMDNVYNTLFTYVESLKSDDTKPLPANLQEVMAMLPAPPWEPLAEEPNTIPGPV